MDFIFFTITHALDEASRLKMEEARQQRQERRENEENERSTSGGLDGAENVMDLVKSMLRGIYRFLKGPLGAMTSLATALFGLWLAVALLGTVQIRAAKSASFAARSAVYAAIETDVQQNSVMKWNIRQLSPRSTERLDLKIIPRDSRTVDLAVRWSYAPIEAVTQIEVQEPKLQMSVRLSRGLPRACSGLM